MTAIVALLGSLHWAVGPACWLALPAATWLRRGAPPAWGLAWPRPARRAAVEIAAATLVVAAVAWWVAGCSREGAPVTVATVLLHVLWIAPSEELFFRGHLQGALRGPLGAASATAVAAACFAISHAAIARDLAGLATIAPALLFGALRERQGSVLGPVLCHAAANLSLLTWAARAV